MRDNPLIALLIVFVPLSLLSVGGGPSILAGIQNQAVEVRHWMNERDFIDLFAIARAAPGPGVLLGTLIGWKVAGLTGALVASVALFLPSSLLYYALIRSWNRHRGKPWHTALELGLAPVAAGLILAGTLVILETGESGIFTWAVALGATAVLMLRPKLNPLWLLAAGGVVALVAG